MNTITILSIYGTRPEAIKMAPVIKEFGERTDHIRSIVCSTGQHREMLKQTESVFDIVPAIRLEAMRDGQTLCSLTSTLIKELASVVDETGPDWIVAQGDTTSVLSASIVAFFSGVRFAHVEAGLRTGDLRKPYPEEFNRLVADLVASAYFCPTQRNADQLLAEGKLPSSIHVTGNTVVDALKAVASKELDWAGSALTFLRTDQKIVTITSHRRESFGSTFEGICQAIKILSRRFPHTQFVYPVHLNPNIKEPTHRILGDCPNVFLLAPLPYELMVSLLSRSYFIMTDSGGIQEEAPALNVPVLVMRDATERPEGVAAGVAKLCGTRPDDIVCSASALLASQEANESMRNLGNPYGDGFAAVRIADALIRSSS